MRAKAKRAADTRSFEVNPDCVPDSANPHSWLVLTGDDVDRNATRVMYGCLRPNFRGHANSAAAFASAKLTVGAPPNTPPWRLTAARAEVLLPPGADDRLSDPRVLMETVDAELPVKAKALLTYLTFTFPTPRLHEQYEMVRDFTRRLIVEPFEVAALLVQHAPHRAGFASPAHVHTLIAGPRRLTPLGFGEWVTPLATDRAHALVGNAFRQFQADWRHV
jgi:hypothetical protein